MQFNISFKTIFEYILKKLVLCIQIRFVSTEKTTRIASRASCYNYRPISLLPSLSKYFGYVIFDQILIENNLLSLEQYRFPPGHSIPVNLVDHLISQLDNHSTPINVYIDLSKAFDTLNHNILLSKLQYYGVTKSSNNLLCSYLLGRSQFLEYNGF